MKFFNPSLEKSKTCPDSILNNFSKKLNSLGENKINPPIFL